MFRVWAVCGSEFGILGLAKLGNWFRVQGSKFASNDPDHGSAGRTLMG